MGVIMKKILCGFVLVWGLGMLGYGIFRVLQPNPNVALLGWTEVWAPGLLAAIFGTHGLVLGLVGLFYKPTIDVH